MTLVEKRYGVFHTLLPPDAQDAPYQVSHTSRLFLIDRQGDVRHLLIPDQPMDSIKAGVKKLLEKKSWIARILVFGRKAEGPPFEK